MTGYANNSHTSAEDIYHRLKEDILILRLKPGQMISENEVANTYNVSRTPIKTAFMRLKGENYVDIVPQKGTFVTPLDIKYVKDAIYMRSVLETDMLKRIIQSSNYNDVVALLEQNMNKQREVLNPGSVDPENFYDVDNHFHFTLFHAMNRVEMWNIVQYCQVYYTRFRMLDYTATARYQQLVTEHERILNALKQKDMALLESVVFDHLHGALYILADRIETDFREYFVDPAK